MNEEKETSKANKKETKSKKSQILYTVLLILCVVVFLVSGVMTLRYYIDKRQAQKSAENIGNLIEEPTQEETTQDYGDTVFPDGIQEKYKRAYAVNSDLVGWITVPNTAINHPVVQAKDNDYYLRRRFEDKVYVEHGRGTIYMDYHNVVGKDGFRNTNTILFGHNYLDSTMFSDLEKYKDIEFWKQNPVIEFNTIYQDYKWKVTHVFLTNASPKDNNGYVFNYIYPNLHGENYKEYFEELNRRALYTTGIDMQIDDKILTLSTCTRDMDLRGQGQTNARCVVVARMVRDGESEAVDTALATVNPNPQYPQIWYDKHKQQNPYQDTKLWYPKGAKAQ